MANRPRHQVVGCIRACGQANKHLCNNLGRTKTHMAEMSAAQLSLFQVGLLKGKFGFGFRSEFERFGCRVWEGNNALAAKPEEAPGPEADEAKEARVAERGRTQRKN